MKKEKDQAEKGKSSGYGGYGGYGQTKKAKKKVEKVVVEEKVSPFATSPLMVALSTLAVRTGPSHDTPLVATCVKILPGSLVRVGGSETLTFKEKLMTKPVNEMRMHIELDGDKAPLGWVTGVSRDEIETLKLAARGFPLMRATKTMAIREGTLTDSPKVGEVPKDSSIRVMETVMTEDGHEKARVSRDGIVANPVGWITTVAPAKAGEVKTGGEEQSLLIPTKALPIVFDLRVHTANSLMNVLSGSINMSAEVSSSKRRKEGDGLPVQVAGKRPKLGDQDGPTVSRHEIVDKPATVKMVFNCFNAAFAVTTQATHIVRIWPHPCHPPLPPHALTTRHLPVAPLATYFSPLATCLSPLATYLSPLTTHLS